MPILASLNAKNRSKSPFSIGMLFSIISDLTVDLHGAISDRRVHRHVHRCSLEKELLDLMSGAKGHTPKIIMTSSIYVRYELNASRWT